jgi:hypothetical protein
MLEISGAQRVAFLHGLDVLLQANPGSVAPKSNIRAIGLLVCARLGLAGPVNASRAFSV